MQEPVAILQKCLKHLHLLTATHTAAMSRMGYSAIDMDSTSAPQGKSFMGAFAGAAIGAVVGAVVLGAVVAVDRAVATPATSLYAATAVRPAVTGSMAAVPVRGAQATRAAAGVQYAAAQQAGM